MIPAATKLSEAGKSDGAQGVLIMWKAVSALIVAGVILAAVSALPFFTAEVEAHAAAPAFKAEQVHEQRFGGECSQRSWPYFEPACLRVNGGDRRSVRLVTTDRVSDFAAAR